MNPALQEILHNITSRLAALEQSAQSDKLLIDLIQEQRAEIDRLRAAQPEQEPVCDKDPYYCGYVRCQLGKVCKNTAPPKREQDTNEVCKKLCAQARRSERGACHQIVWDYGFSRIDNEEVQAACVDLAQAIRGRGKHE